MKKLSLLAILAVTANFVLAQDIDEIKKYAYLNQPLKAKEAVDKYLAVEKNAKKPEGWYYKGYACNMLSKDSSKSTAESAALKSEAYESLKKYRQIDPKAELLTEQNNSTLYDLYVGYSADLGVKEYAAKDVAAAFESFKKGLEIHDYIVANNLAGPNGFKFSALDTTLVLYTAITAAELKKQDDAVMYYQKLADANVSDAQYIDAYQVLADYYKTKKNDVAFASIIEKGKKFYPKNNEYWTAMEIENAVEGVAKPAVFKKYDELLVKYPADYTVAYNYAVELYHYIYSDEAKGVNMEEYKAKLQDATKKAIAVKSSSEANFLLANFLYNNSIDVSEEARKIKGPKPDDLKKKRALEADATKQMNDAIPFAETVVNNFSAIAKPKNSEKINYKQSLTILKNTYEVKKDVAKTAMYEKKLKEVE